MRAATNDKGWVRAERLAGCALFILSLAAPNAYAADSTAAMPISPPPPLTEMLAMNAGEGVHHTVNTPADEKVTAMAQETIRRLNDSTTNLTVEDLNGVRQVVAKLDALIDIEKHLNELDKVREEHHGGKASMTPVPASELAPPLPVTVPVAAPPPPLPLPNAMQQNTGPGAQLLRISGYDGHYAATFRIAGVETATLRVGDHDPDIGTVKMITASSVQVERNGDMRTMHVRNVDTIFNSSNY